MYLVVGYCTKRVSFGKRKEPHAVCRCSITVYNEQPSESRKMLHAVLLLHPIARKMKAAGGLGSFYVLGRKAMAVFDPSVMTWTTLAKPPDHGMNAAAAVYDSKIYVSGGYASSEKRLGRHSQKTPLVPKRSIRPEQGVTQSIPRRKIIHLVPPTLSLPSHAPHPPLL